MISRSSIPKQIEKGGKMPQGKGTYGSKVGRPARKEKTAGPKAMMKLARDKSKVLKNPNTPGEGKRGFEGMVNRMVSMSESQFNKMIKNIRAKRR